jgi:tripeptidyl-peptidase-2
MMTEQYSLREALKEVHYTWSSRGPTIDGSLGVSGTICYHPLFLSLSPSSIDRLDLRAAVTAPGGAISPLPLYTLQRSQLMNGTSMSSPNCAGCVAILLSALKAQGLKYSPASMLFVLHPQSAGISVFCAVAITVVA